MKSIKAYQWTIMLVLISAVLGCSDAPTPSPPAGSTASVTVRWDASTSTNLAGYKIYVGTVSGQYGSPVDVGNVTSYVMKDLTLGDTYFFAVTSYNGSGVESAYSNEVSQTVY
jgi:fibronectin type 3 domain-containing protein